MFHLGICRTLNEIKKGNNLALVSFRCTVELSRSKVCLLLIANFYFQKFLTEIQEQFKCICCQELLYQPVTTDCKHNICLVSLIKKFLLIQNALIIFFSLSLTVTYVFPKACLKRSFSAEVYNCPMCRHELGKEFKMKVNEHLAAALQHLFAGYEAGR